jgi:periplasmic protein CpxP/Spy
MAKDSSGELPHRSSERVRHDAYGTIQWSKALKYFGSSAVWAESREKDTPTLTKGNEILMTTEAKTKIIDELQRFAADLKLSESQKSQLQTALEKAEDRIEEIRRANPDVTRADVIHKLAAARDQIRQHVVAFLSPEQLKKWDAEMAKARTFLGHPVQV